MNAVSEIVEASSRALMAVVEKEQWVEDKEGEQAETLWLLIFVMEAFLPSVSDLTAARKLHPSRCASVLSPSWRLPAHAV